MSDQLQRETELDSCSPVVCTTISYVIDFYIEHNYVQPISKCSLSWPQHCIAASHLHWQFPYFIYWHRNSIIAKMQNNS